MNVFSFSIYESGRFWSSLCFPLLHLYFWIFVPAPHISQTQRSTVLLPQISPLQFHLPCRFSFVSPFQWVLPLFPCTLCSFTFFSPLLTATQSHLSVDRMVPIGLIIVLAVLIKMLLGTRRFDLAWHFSGTAVALILDLSCANHVNICCFLQDCYSSWFDSIRFDPIRLYIEYYNSHSTTVFNAFQYCRDQLTSAS